MKKYQVELNINAVVYGNAIRHKATYVIEADIREGWEDCAAPMALIENWEDIIEQFHFISPAIGEGQKSIVENHAANVCFAESSKTKVTEI
ncbi:MAG: hypothetical protein VB979_00025 [Acinetobacter sp.]|uniref:hypothetical protein n=1 Tax=Acinetobacter sp. TaxID=472 RepID=UPI003981BF34